MSRKLFIAGNWKMNTTKAGGVDLAAGLVKRLGSQQKVDVAVCPPFVYLDAVAQACKGSAIAVGAQDLYY